MKTIKRLNSTLKYFNIVDSTMFKICLITLGLLVGIYYSDLLMSYTNLIWLIFVISTVFILTKIFKYYRDIK
ncbi:MAG: hypothetical protein RRZ64_07290 [Rikenellaceae bacterium]